MTDWNQQKMEMMEAEIARLHKELRSARFWFWFMVAIVWIIPLIKMFR